MTTLACVVFIVRDEFAAKIEAMKKIVGKRLMYKELIGQAELAEVNP